MKSICIRLSVKNPTRPVVYKIYTQLNDNTFLELCEIIQTEAKKLGLKMSDLKSIKVLQVN